MTTNQEARQIAIRDVTSTTGNTSSDWHALFDDASIAAGPFNARMLAWINDQLGASYTNLPGAMHAYAANGGAARWSDVTTLGEAGFNPATLTGIIGVYDVSDLSSMTVGRDGSGGAPSVGDPVGTLADQSAAGTDLAAPSDAARPVLRQTGGGLYYLEHDGVDDALTSAAIATAAAPIYIAAAIEKQAESSQALVGLQLDGLNYARLANVASASRLQGQLRFGGTLKLATSTTGVAPIDTPLVVEISALAQDLSLAINNGTPASLNFAPDTFTSFTNAAFSTVNGAGQIYFAGAVVRAGTANSGTDAADIRTWLADRNGATLA